MEEQGKFPQEVLDKIEEARRTGATSLDLRGNQLRSLPQSITQLTKLTELYLSDNQLSSLPESITQLTNLTTLYLSFNQLSSLPENITKLTKLKKLYFRFNQLNSLPENIGELINLTWLDLSYNQINNLPESIRRLTQLTTLSYSDNQLDSLPESITKLTKLTWLYLSSNQLGSLPESITKLTKLKKLDLSGNQLSSLPQSITQMTNLKTLDLSGNPLIAPPPEIANKGIQAIRNYFEELAKSSVKLYEAKMLLIGQGEVGKTSLKSKLINPDFNVQSLTTDDRTHGIEIDQWKIKCELEKESKDIILNIWDFGGQEIYHATHQFFLTKRSLYILLGDTTRQDNQFKYWLNVVNLLGGDAPVLVVMNKVDKMHAQLNQAEYKNNFQQIENFHSTSLLTGVGIEDLRRQIKDSIAKLPHLGDEIPGRWLDVRKRLEQDGRNFIDYDDYLDICEEFEMDEERAEFLIDYLHDLGVVLHFKHNRILRNYVILEPEWGTQAIYKVLDPKVAPDFMKDQLGHFVFGDLQKVWKERKVYKGMARDILLELMLTFELCFKLQDTETYIVPELLPENAPKSADFTPFQKSTDLLRFEYRYDFMPKGLMTRFICRIHKLIKEKSFWKSGVIVQFENSIAYIKHQFLQRKISVQLVGNDRRELLAIIRSQFDHIHNTLNNLKVDQMVPCICEDCKKQERPNFYEYAALKKRVEKRKLTIECAISYDNVNVKALLEGIQHRLNVEKIEQYIKDTQIEEAIVELEKAQVDSQQIIMLRNRWNRYVSDKQTNRIERKDLEVTYSQIISSILDMIKDYQGRYR